jgi:hypothetical protein
VTASAGARRAERGDALDRFAELARDFRSAARARDFDRMDVILDERRELLLRLQAGGERIGRDADALRAILGFDRESRAILEAQRRALRTELVALDSGCRGLAGDGSI